MNVMAGIVLVTLAGLGTGTYIWPMKIQRHYKFEHCWFVGMLTMLVFLPWAPTLLFCPNFFQALQGIAPGVLLKANLFSACFGIAVVLFGICAVRIGVALAGAILSGVSVIVGVTMPLVVKAPGFDAPDLTSTAGTIVLSGVAVMVIGVVFVAIAGFAREKQMRVGDGRDRGRPTGSFMAGLVMSIIAGALSTGISFTFVYSQQPVIAAMKAQGASDTAANLAVWALGMMGAAFVNALYTGILMIRNKSWAVLYRNPRDLLLAVCLGLHFGVAVMFLLGRGMLFLGALGPSVGFGIQQAMQILGNQGLGFISGEWRGVRGTARTAMIAAIVVLLAASAALAIGNRFSSH